MAIQHLTLPVCGVQFHPESVLTDYGLIILNNWLKTCQKGGIVLK
jgi:anthranilate/para-aminobenzoate synthase component II